MEQFHKTTKFSKKLTDFTKFLPISPKFTKYLQTSPNFSKGHQSSESKYIIQSCHSGIRRRLAPMAYPTVETSVPFVSTTQVQGPYVEFFWIYAFPLE